VIHLFRAGRWYESLDSSPVRDGSGWRVCLAPEIILRDDARRRPERRATVPDRRAIVERAVELFRFGTVRIGGVGAQSAGAFEAAMREVAGLPAALTRRWGALLAGAVRALPDARPDAGPDGGLGAGLDAGPVAGLDGGPGRGPGAGTHPGLAADTLVWLPGNTFTCLEAVAEAALAGGTVWVRPSRREPVSAARFVAAMLAAGWPPERIGFYPTRTELLPVMARLTDRQIVYGGAGLVAAAPAGPGLTVRGPGRGCAVVPAGADPGATAEWLAGLIAADSGRFCRNVCTVGCLGDPAPVAAALGGQLDGIRLTPPDPRWPQASVPPAEAERAAAVVHRGLRSGDAVVTTRELIVNGDETFLAPTLVRVSWAPDHPLLGRELGFPFAGIVGVSPDQAAGLTQASRFVHALAVPS